MIPLDDRVLVAGQIRPADLPDIAAAGVTVVVNNRPDGEEPGQPPAADIGAAARAAGLDYRFIPIVGGIPSERVEAMAQALDEADGKLLAFCRSGTRSTYLWALARRWQGVQADELLRQAEAAGYDLRALLPHLR